jgi:hypothetical protein
MNPSSIKAFREFVGRVPEGHRENSPAFQRRDRRTGGTSPVGTAEVLRDVAPGFNRPFGTQTCCFARPSVETLGYCRMSLRDTLPNKFPSSLP